MTGRSGNALPVDAILSELIATLRTAPCVVLQAATGAGKTTRVPPALLDAFPGEVIVLEPRRVAARAAARRVAAERGTRLGGEVGYEVRFDRRRGAETRLAYVTEGVLLRRLQEDPFLEGVGALVFDEFHERRLDAELGLAMARRVQREVRGDLRIVVTSATLDGEAVAAALGGAPRIETPGRMFPVEELYLPRDPREEETAHVVRAVRQALGRDTGDVLVFLPGVGEIRRAAEALEGTARTQGFDLRELYGDLDPERQDAALQRGARRRVVLATNVAETSVTVEGVTAVVDSGQARRLAHDPSVGLDRLELVRISAASAEQRKGRAGREAPGQCIRLWSLAEHRGLAVADEPEVRRLDLAGPALALYAWGERDLDEFPWFEAPPPAALARAKELLGRLGAVDAGGVTELGRAMARLSVHPRLARLLVAGAGAGVLERAALAAALLAERDPFERSRGPRSLHDARARVGDSDVLERVLALESFEERSARSRGELHVRPAGARFVLRARDQLVRLARRAADVGRPAADPDEALLRALLAAYPDRLARRRSDGDERGVMVGGRGVRLARESVVTEGELFLAIDLEARRGGDALVRLASRVERDWIDGGVPHEVVTYDFDADRQRVVATKELRLGELAIEVREHPAEDPVEIERVLVEAARADLARALDLTGDTAEWLARVRWLGAERPDLGLPRFDEAELGAHVGMLAAGCRSFADLRRAPLVANLAGTLTHGQRTALEREAPERLRVPSGSQLKLAYEPGRPPVLAVRVQEMFGLAETPTLAGGRVRVLLHLLAPNGRPEQVTDDLASFWANTYPQVRKDLRIRYPKHAWPEDPTTASPQRRPGRRRR